MRSGLRFGRCLVFPALTLVAKPKLEIPLRFAGSFWAFNIRFAAKHMAPETQTIVRIRAMSAHFRKRFRLKQLWAGHGRPPISRHPFGFPLRFPPGQQQMTRTLSEVPALPTSEIAGLGLRHTWHMGHRCSARSEPRSGEHLAIDPVRAQRVFAVSLRPHDDRLDERGL